MMLRKKFEKTFDTYKGCQKWNEQWRIWDLVMDENGSRVNGASNAEGDVRSVSATGIVYNSLSDSYQSLFLGVNITEV